MFEDEARAVLARPARAPPVRVLSWPVGERYARLSADQCIECSGMKTLRVFMRRDAGALRLRECK